jgi:hypothetical protein
MSYILVLYSNAVSYGVVIPVFEYVSVQATVGAIYLVFEVLFFTAAIHLTISDPTEVTTIKTKYYLSKK